MTVYDCGWVRIGSALKDGRRILDLRPLILHLSGDEHRLTVLAICAKFFDVSFVMASLAVSIYALARFIAYIPVGVMADRFGRKPIILNCLTITAIACTLLPLTSDYLTISLVVVLLGIGTSGAQQAPLAMASDATINEPHGLCMGVYRSFGDVGYAIGPLMVGFVADGYGLRMPFYFMAGLIFTKAFLILTFARETYSRRSKNSVRKSQKTEFSERKNLPSLAAARIEALGNDTPIRTKM